MMKKLSLALALCAFALPASAQQVTNARATAAAPTYVNATANPLSMDLTGALRVVNSGSPSGTQDVNVTKIGGVALAYGQQLMAASIPVTLASNQSGLAVTGTFFQATQPVSIASGQVASGAIASGAVASGAYASGAFASGSFASGSITAGAFAAGQPAQANWGQGATAAAVPANATLAGARSGANMVPLIQADASAAITMSTATTTEFIALSGSTKIYITSFDFLAAGATNVTLKYGTGTNCGTGTTSLTGLYTLTAQAGVAKGSGLGPVLVVPAGNAFCVTNSAAVVIGGSVSYTQF